MMKFQQNAVTWPAMVSRVTGGMLCSPICIISYTNSATPNSSGRFLCRRCITKNL